MTTSDCPECHGDPRGFLGFMGYTPCKTCNVQEPAPTEEVPDKIQWDAWNDEELKFEKPVSSSACRAKKLIDDGVLVQPTVKRIGFKFWPGLLANEES